MVATPENWQNIYKSLTGKDSIPAFNADEQEFLKLSLVETAAIRDRSEILSVESLGDKASLLHLAAKELGLIRNASTPKPGGDERPYRSPSA